MTVLAMYGNGFLISLRKAVQEHSAGTMLCLEMKSDRFTRILTMLLHSSLLAVAGIAVCIVVVALCICTIPLGMCTLTLGLGSLVTHCSLSG